MSDNETAVKSDGAAGREAQVRYLAQRLHIPRDEASILLEHLEARDDA